MTLATGSFTSRLAAASFPRFLLVGGSFALINALLAATLTALLPLPAAACAALAWLACIPPAWACQRRFSFHRATVRRGGGLLYFVSQILGVGISAGAGGLFAGGSFAQDVLIYMLAALLAAVVSYAIARLVIFGAPSPGSQTDPRR